MNLNITCFIVTYFGIGPIDYLVSTEDKDLFIQKIKEYIDNIYADFRMKEIKELDLDQLPNTDNDNRIWLCLKDEPINKAELFYNVEELKKRLIIMHLANI